MAESTCRRLYWRWTLLLSLLAMFLLSSAQSDDFYMDNGNQFDIDTEANGISPLTHGEEEASMKENHVPTQDKTDTKETDESKEPSVWETYQEVTRRLLVVKEDGAVSEPEITPPVETVDPNRPPGLEELELLAFNLEYADENILVKLIDWAYDWVANDQGYKDKFIRVKDLPDFFHRALNPADDDIDDAEYSLLAEASHQLREEQGLLDDDHIIHRGFLARGHPLRYMRKLAHEMHVQHQSRRLQAADRDL